MLSQSAAVVHAVEQPPPSELAIPPLLLPLVLPLLRLPPLPLRLPPLLVGMTPELPENGFEFPPESLESGPVTTPASPPNQSEPLDDAAQPTSMTARVATSGRFNADRAGVGIEQFMRVIYLAPA